MAISGMRPEFKEAIGRAFNCSLHKQRQCEIFCEDCAKFFCSNCFVKQQHEKHRCQNMDDAAKSEFDRIKTDAIVVRSRLGARKNETERFRNEFMDGLEKTKRSITGKGEDLKRQVDVIVQKLIQDIDKEGCRMDRKFSDEVHTFDECVKKLEKMVVSSETVSHGRHFRETMEAAKELHTVIVSVNRNDENFKPVQVPAIRFIPADDAEVAAKIDVIKDFVGRLKCPPHILPMTKLEAGIRRAKDLEDRKKEDETLNNDVLEQRKLYNKKGFACLMAGTYEKVEKWRKLPLKIAIIGNSGVGKSSFINAVRCMTADDQGAAEVDVNETTRTINYYSHPDFPQIRFCDLPGVGTPGFPKDTYLKNICFDSYDFFLLMSDNRFKENDFWLAQEITKAQKMFYFVRTKVAIDVGMRTADMKEQQVLDEIKRNIEQDLKRNNVNNDGLFLIDNYQQDKFDFELLERYLMSDAQHMKHLAMIMSISSIKLPSSCVIL